jgi:predicted transcriptional regulator
MFSIYGESGRLFNGAWDDLWRIEALRSVMRARRVQNDEVVLPAHQTSVHGPAPHSHQADVALSAYAQASDTAPQRHPLSRVGDVMSPKVRSVSMDITVLQAWQLLAEEGIGQAPVLSEAGQLVGLLTRAELMSLDRLPRPDASTLVWRALLMEPVSAIMISPVPAVSEDTDLRQVARVLANTHLPGLPVVSEPGHLQGFISRSDLLKALVHEPPLDLWS